MRMTKSDIEIIASGISNSSYYNNLETTKQLVELFDRIPIKHRPLNEPEDYIFMYDDNFYTYWTWEELVKSEEEQNNGLTEEECVEELGKTIFKLPCGWYVQYV